MVRRVQELQQVQWAKAASTDLFEGGKRLVEDATVDQGRAESNIELGNLLSQSESLARLPFERNAIKRLRDARRSDVTPAEAILLRQTGVDLSTEEGKRVAGVLLRNSSESSTASMPQNDSFGGNGSGPPWVLPEQQPIAMRGFIDFDGSVTGRPRFTGDDRIFFDLVSYAPGMDTSRADLLAVLEAEAAPSPMSRPGNIDDSARRLFEKARPQGWQTITFPAEGNRPGFGITFDGTGRYSYERTLPPGIRERVVCDGKTLLHLYPDLGIGARRIVSRFHRLEFARAVPWAVPSPDDMARGADLKLIAERTVAVVPHGADRKDADGKPIPYATVQYLFGEDGRLAERLIVEMPANKVRYRQVFGADGTITSRDGDGKELAVVKATLRDGKQPDLKADTKDLVVLPLPYRDIETTRKALGIQKKHFTELTFDEARAVLAAEFGAGNGTGVLEVCKQSLFPRDQKQLGLYVLLAACGVNLDSGNVDVLEEHLHEPLAQYLALHSSPVLRKHASQWAVGSGQWGEGFLQHLAVTHALYQRWSNGKALGATDEKRREERDRALEYVRRNKGTAFGWGLLCLMKDRADEDEAAKKDVRDTHKALAEAWPLFREVRALVYAAEYEHARSLWKAGQHTEARQRFVDLYEGTLKAGGLPAHRCRLPPGAGGCRSRGRSMGRPGAQDGRGAGGGQAPAGGAGAGGAVPPGRRRGDGDGAARHGAGRHQGRQGASGNDARGHRRPARDGAVRGGRPAAARPARRPRGGEAGGPVAAGGTAGGEARPAGAGDGVPGASAGRRVPQPAGGDRPAPVREEYGRLLGHYQDLANALERLKMRPPDNFVSTVVRTADRWRAIDPEADGACEIAGRILRTLGERELVWDYLTTPVARRPNESGPWVALAGTLSRTGELDLADRAYAAAFEAEPTNAQILWDRAQNLRQAGKLTEARKLYRQLAEGDWQPRFNWVRSQAKWQLEKK